MAMAVSSSVVLLTHAQNQPPIGAAYTTPNGIIVGASYQNDVSPPLRDMKPVPYSGPPERDVQELREANMNPKLPHKHLDAPDPIVQSFHAVDTPEAMPAPILNFDGIPFPGVACNCAPPDTDGEVGATQYVQIVNEGYQVFDKSTGASVLGPVAIATIWNGFGGLCQTNGAGDPIVVYDQIAQRWLISQFAGTITITDECIAISATSDATGTYNRYGFHLGSNFYDYPKIAVWPDGYYMSDNVFNSSGSAFLGPQAFAFNRAAMLAGNPATFVTPGISGGSSEPSFLPADLDGSALPGAGAPDTFVSYPDAGVFKVWHFHADFASPANTAFTVFATPPAAAFAALCPSTRACVPESGGGSVDGIGDRLMFRLAYRQFGDHESVVGNFTVSSNGVAGIRWFELRNVTSGPVTVNQESTYQPDATSRWMGSIAMDRSGNIALGFSASDSSINPQIRYAGRLTGDPLNVLSRGEAHIFDGTGSQTGTGNRWGDYSAMSVDPVDDCTFWYTQEYYVTTGTFNWRTRIASFKFPSCGVTGPFIVSNDSSVAAESCTAPNGRPDPGEVLTINFTVQNGGTMPTSPSLTGTLRNTGGVTGATGAQVYGAIPPGGTVARPFTFTASGTCGTTITATIHMQDGVTDLGDLTYDLPMGGPAPPFFVESFDGVSAPALPAQWSTSHSGAQADWVTSTSSPFDGANAAFAPDPADIGESDLMSPVIAIPAVPSATLSFRNNYVTESNFDGMVLEISIDGAGFNDITTGGNTFLASGYNGTISSSWGNPLAGRSAWTGNSLGYANSSINLPNAALGHDVRLKWRMGSDNGVGSTGVRIDKVALSQSGLVCATSCGPAITFTDDPLTPGMTIVQRQHILELRSNIDAQRVRFGLSGFGWTDNGLPSQTQVKAIHISEMRTALGEAFAADGLIPPTYTDPTLTQGSTIVKAIHLTELRNALRTLAGS